MAHGADAIGQDPGKRQVRLIARQAQGQRAKGLGHGGAVDHAQHRYAEMARQVCAGRRTVEQAHDPFNQNQVGFARCFPQQTAAFVGTDHPQIQLIDRRATGALENHRVEKVRAAFEHPNLAPLIAVQSGQRGSHGSLALA